MLNSCASPELAPKVFGVNFRGQHSPEEIVVNNGFGADYAASLINQLAKP